MLQYIPYLIEHTGSPLSGVRAMVVVIPVIDYGSVVAALRHVMFSMAKRLIDCGLPVFPFLSITAPSRHGLLRDAVWLE